VKLLNGDVGKVHCMSLPGGTADCWEKDLSPKRGVEKKGEGKKAVKGKGEE